MTDSTLSPLSNTDVRPDTLRQTIKTAATLLNQISKAPGLFPGASNPTKQTLPNHEKKLLKSLGGIFDSASSLLSADNYRSTLEQLAKKMLPIEKDLFTQFDPSRGIEDASVNPYFYYINSQLMGSREKIRNIFMPSTS